MSKAYTTVEVSESKSSAFSKAPNGSSSGTDHYTTVISRQTWTEGKLAGRVYKITSRYISQNPNVRGQYLNSSSEPWI